MAECGSSGAAEGNGDEFEDEEELSFNVGKNWTEIQREGSISSLINVCMKHT